MSKAIPKLRKPTIPPSAPTLPKYNINILGSAWTGGVVPAQLNLIGTGGSAGTFITGTITVDHMNSFTLQGFTITGTSPDFTTGVVTFTNNTGAIT